MQTCPCVTQRFSLRLTKFYCLDKNMYFLIFVQKVVGTRYGAALTSRHNECLKQN